LLDERAILWGEGMLWSLHKEKALRANQA